MARSQPARTAAAVLLAAAGVLAVAKVAAAQSEPGVETPAPQQLATARTVLILDTSMHFGLSSEFLQALDEWGRLERVFLPDEADLCFALSTRPDFTTETLPGEGEGTVRVIDKLYFKIFVPGNEEVLWSDEVDLEDEMPADLILRLDERIAELEAATGNRPAGASPESDDAPLPAELLEAQKVVLRDTSGSFPLLLEFQTALVDWGRFELVPTPDEADLCFAFSSEIEYSERYIPTGAERTTPPPQEGLRPRREGTVRTIDTLYLRVFVPGQGEEFLWEDQIDAAADEPARQLVERLRARVGRAETEGSSEGT